MVTTFGRIELNCIHLLNIKEVIQVQICMCGWQKNGLVEVAFAQNGDPIHVDIVMNIVLVNI